MSEAIQKAWLADYIASYAEEHGSEMLQHKPKKGKVQIIHFRTYPNTEEEWLWADISDKEHWVTARFTKEAVKEYNSRHENAGRSLLSRRHGLANIRVVRPFFIERPRGPGDGLESIPTVSLEIGFVSVVGSEGESIFGNPKEATKEQRVHRWVAGMREPHRTGGNVLRLESLARTASDLEAKLNASKKQEKHPRAEAPKVAPSKPRQKEADYRQRRKLWMKNMKEVGALYSYNNRNIPQSQLDILQTITTFGKNTMEEATRAIKTEENPEHLMDVSAEVPRQMTPSEWEPSQRNNVRESDADINTSDDDDADGEPQVHGPSSSSGGSDDYGSQEEEYATADEEQDEPEEGPGVNMDSSSSQYAQDLEDEKVIETSMPPPPMKKPFVLVPDSDVSGSHSQSLSLTEPSAASHPSQNILQASFLGITQSQQQAPTSQPESPPKGVADLTQLDSDDEAAEALLNTSKDEEVKPTSGAKLISRTKTPRRHQLSSSSQNRPGISSSGGSGRPGSNFHQFASPLKPSSSKLSDVSPIKRKQPSSIPATSPSKRLKQSAMEIERTEHDPDAWKEPSFLAAQSQSRGAEKQPVSPVAETPPPETNSRNLEKQPTTAKLGGWRPRLEVEPGPGIINWKRYNEILFEVLETREAEKNGS